MSASPLHRSQASLSPSNSQAQSISYQDFSLETLVSHLLASKRSLSSISTVWRANEIVTAARVALEESVVLNARTEFLRSGITEQVKVLKKVRNGIEGVYKEGQRDFKSVIKTLDAANTRLETTMDILRSTMVEAAFRPEDEEPRSLLDFVDEQGVEGMRDAVKESIRDAKEAQTYFDTSILAFDDDIRALRDSMKSSPSTSRTGIKSSPTASADDFSSPIPEHLHTLETNAQEMARLLEGLVTHFDLCVNAIRHTEGGYAAVRKAANSQPPDAEHVSVSGVMATENDTSSNEPVSEEEMNEMLRVLQEDAAQLDDVVIEIREYLADMENKHGLILAYLRDLNSAHLSTNTAYQLLDSVSVRLPSYIIASQDFQSHWEETKLNIKVQLDDIENMRIFYESYLSSYDGLIIEVNRRKNSEEKIKGIMRKAMEQIGKLHEVDLREREGFRLDVGDYLPVDLWPDVNTPPKRWEFGIVGTAEEEAKGEVPVLSREVVEAAEKRNRANAEGNR